MDVPEDSLGGMIEPQMRELYLIAYKRFFTKAMDSGLTKVEAEDAAQAALVHVLGQKHRYRAGTGAPILAWMIRVGANHLVDHLRRRQAERRAIAGHRAEYHYASDATPAASVVEARAAAYRLIVTSHLPDDEQALWRVWVRQYDGQLTREEAARELGMTIAEFEAGKKRVKTAILRVTEDLGLTIDDVAPGAQRLRQRAEEARNELE